MEIYGYKRSSFWTLLTWIAIVGTAFLLRIVFFWKPHWMLYSTHKQCSLSCADKVLLIDKFNQYYVEDVHQFVLAKCSFAKILFQQRRSEPDTTGQDLIVGDGGDLKNDGKDSNRRNVGQFSRKAQTYGSFISRCSKASSKKSAAFQVNPETMSGEQVEISLGNYTETKVDDSSMLVDADLDITNNTSINDKHTTNYDAGGDCNDAEAKFNVSFTGTDNSSINNKTFIDEDNNAITVRYFDNKKLRYIWDEQKQNFIILRGLDYNVKLDKLKKMSKGLSRQEQSSRQLLFGSNTIFVEVQTYIKILFEEVLGPFYIFQLFSVLLWFNDDYDYYATCIVIMSLVSLISSVIQIRSNQQQLRDAVKSTGTVKVKRGKDEYEEIDSSLLVPGDIVVVPTFDTLLQFDALLITGNVIVNESMLTGESVPVTKTPMPFESNFQIKPRHLLTTENFDKTNHDDADDTHDTATIENYYDQKEHSKHTLFCGTKVIQTRYYGGANVMALVLRTGFQTTKGELIRSIMFPKPVDFKFNNQIHKFIGMLACCAMIGFIYTVFLKADRGSSVKEIMLSALDLITITVPPALPAAMTIGIIYAQSRLKKKKIYCISPRSINISGCINCVCFDKTGTLTEDDLSFNEVIPFIETKKRFGKPFDEEVLQNCHDLTIAKNNQLMLNNGNYSPLMHCLASCHSLTKIDEKIIGDPLDLQMFEATGWVLEEPDVDDENKFDLLAPTILKPKKKLATNFIDEVQNSASRSSSPENQVKPLDDNNQQTSTNRNQDIGVLRQFPFSSSFQRMSVVTRQLNVNQFVVYSKGAPEKIASLCDPKTIPPDFLDVLHEYTRKGFRVIALAYRPLKQGISYTKMQRASRATLEKDLNFLGLLTLGNLLKAETESVIDTLTKAAIRTIMVTGDNMQTAISVANDCGMILPYDRTVLLEVKATNEDHIELNKLQASKHSNTINTQLESNTTKNPLVLSVDDVAGQFDNETEPILSRLSESSISKQIPRPELTWKYVSNGSDFTPMCMKSSDSVMLKLSDNNRLHLALTGDTFEAVINHYPELLDSVCVRGTVFARMSPNQKQQLVEHLQSLQYYVGMCGDGANDSGALRAAHAGISLSDTEASVAAPFTSANPNISCVPALIIEGRAALVTAFSILKYMALYSLAQFCSVILLYTVYSNFSDFQFMYEDMFIIAVIIASFGRTEPYPELARKPPSSSLLSMTQISSCLIQLVLVAIFQGLVCVLLWNEPWYVEHKPDYDHNFNTQDNYAIFFMSSFQCITLAIVFSKAKPYKKSILSNYPLAISFAVIISFTLAILFIPAESGFYFTPIKVFNIPTHFRVILLCCIILHFSLAILGEHVIVDKLIFSKGSKLLELLGINSQRLLYEKIDQETQSTHWLPVALKTVV